MNFKAMQDSVLSEGFAESKRADAKNWINNRLQWIWDAEGKWTFKQATASVTVTVNSMLVTGTPADLGVVLAVFAPEGWPLEPIDDWQTFSDRYIGPPASSGIPEAFTVLDKTIYVGPKSSVTSSLYNAAYERDLVLLVNDGDVPTIPEGYHMGPVAGAKALGFRLINNPLADGFDAEFKANVDSMRRRYLHSMKPANQQWPAYRV